MRYNKEDTERLLVQLEEHLKKAPEFSSADVAALHELLQAWRGWAALGKGTKWLITVLGLLAAAIASWNVLGKAIKDWVTS